MQYFAYDARHRLTACDWRDGDLGQIYSFEYDYDAVGNRLRLGRELGDTYYTYDTVNQVVTAVGPDGARYYEFDENGNRSAVTNTDGTTYYAWTSADMLSRIDFTDSTSVTFYYDGDLNRVRKGSGTTQYTLDGLSVIMEQDGNGETTAAYVHGYSSVAGTGSLVAQDVASSVSFAHQDHAGSTVGLSDESGGAAAGYEYSPFGQTLGQTGSGPTSSLMAGRLHDSEAGQYHFAGGEYDPSLGQYLSPGQAYTGLAYSYCNADPVGLSQPAGSGATVASAATASVGATGGAGAGGGAGGSGPGATGALGAAPAQAGGGRGGAGGGQRGPGGVARGPGGGTGRGPGGGGPAGGGPGGTWSGGAGSSLAALDACMAACVSAHPGQSEIDSHRQTMCFQECDDAYRPNEEYYTWPNLFVDALVDPGPQPGDHIAVEPNQSHDEPVGVPSLGDFGDHLPGIGEAAWGVTVSPAPAPREKATIPPYPPDKQESFDELLESYQVYIDELNEEHPISPWVPMVIYEALEPTSCGTVAHGAAACMNDAIRERRRAGHEYYFEVVVSGRAEDTPLGRHNDHRVVIIDRETGQQFALDPFHRILDPLVYEVWEQRYPYRCNCDDGIRQTHTHGCYND